VRLVGGGHGNDLGELLPGEIAVAMVQSLAAVPEATKLMGSAAVVVVDECHHCPADSWANVLNRCPARWRWGLTATPERADGWTFLMHEIIGRILYQRTTIELIELGHLLRPLVVPVHSPMSTGRQHYTWTVRCTCGHVRERVDWVQLGAGEVKCSRCASPLGPANERQRGRMMWPRVLSDWSASDETAAVVSALGEAAWHAGRRTLVLVPRKSAAVAHADRLSQAGMQADSVTSKSRARDQRIDRLRTGSLDALVATQLADEGLDVPEVDCLIMASAGKAKGTAAQRSGRACRPAGHEQPVIFDLVASPLGHQWKQRCAVYLATYGLGCLHSIQPVTVAEAVKVLAGDEE